MPRTLIAVALVIVAGAVGGCTEREPTAPALPPRLTQQELIGRAERGVVAVKSRGRADVTTGTAFVIDASRGLLVTAAHVTRGGSNIKVRLPDRTTHPARLVGEQVCGDIALLQVVGDTSSLRTLPLGDGAALVRNSETTLLHFGSNIQAFGRQGMSTSPLTVANPVVDHPELGTDMPPVDDLIQLQGVVPPGASGGPVLDRDGGVVGMAVMGETEEPQAYALPASAIRGVLPALRRRSRQDLLGLTGMSVRDVDLARFYAYDLGPSAGREVASIVDRGLREAGLGGFFVSDAGGAAERAGIGFGDLITSVNGTEVRSMRGVCGVLDSASPGDLLTLRGRHLAATDDLFTPFRRTVRAPR
jgi:serine protease Do